MELILTLACFAIIGSMAVYSSTTRRALVRPSYTPMDMVNWIIVLALVQAAFGPAAERSHAGDLGALLVGAAVLVPLMLITNHYQDKFWSVRGAGDQRS